ncbi:MAG: hypothetical protein P1U34_00680 [Coxiellaceae bacterium]|nr:hypothetical protein [Coxiellaceae bacterium]
MRSEHPNDFDINSAEYLELVSSVDKRQALAKVIMRVFDHWQLDTATQLKLLGMGAKSRALIGKYRNGDSSIAANQDSLQRVGYLLGIFQCLKSLYPDNEALRHGWVKCKNKKLDNFTPLEIMLNGIPDIKCVYALLQHQMVR